MKQYHEVIDFPMARAIYWRAAQILKNRTTEERINGGNRLMLLIREFSENRLAEEIESYISEYSNKLVEHGGWELGYFPDHYRDEHGTFHISRADAAHLLENWPDHTNLPDGYPDELMTDIDSLSEILCNGVAYDDLKECSGLSEWECYALMAETKIRELQQRLTGPAPHRFDRNRLSAAQFLDASQSVTEAMEFVCHAERSLWDHQLEKLSAERRHSAEIELRRTIRRSMAQDAARRKVESDPKQLAKQQVRECWELWQKEPSRYRGKAAFARDMLNKYEDLKSQPVIEGWCREWGSSSS